MVICLEQGANLHMAQLMPLPLAVSCFSKIQIDFAFLVPAHPGSPGQRAVKWVCVCVCVHGCHHHLHYNSCFFMQNQQQPVPLGHRPSLVPEVILWVTNNMGLYRSDTCQSSNSKKHEMNQIALLHNKAFAH